LRYAPDCMIAPRNRGALVLADAVEFIDAMVVILVVMLPWVAVMLPTRAGLR
jgi:hypothetical protein